MLASRHHSRRRKLLQFIRATSALKHSSNQKGLRARNRKRTAAPAASSKIRVSQRTRRAGSDGNGEALGISFTAGSGGCMLVLEVLAIPDDTMLKKFHMTYVETAPRHDPPA